MTISLDFDETYTRDPEMWRKFAHMAVSMGHEIVLITNRTPEQGAEVRAALRGVPVSAVVFAGRAPKREAARRQGIRVDVWVDDLPHTVDSGR